MYTYGSIMNNLVKTHSGYFYPIITIWTTGACIDVVASLEQEKLEQDTMNSTVEGKSIYSKVYERKVENGQNVVNLRY